MGKQIYEMQQNTNWGSGFINQLSKDLKSEFPEIGGFSADNLRRCKSFYLFYNQQVTISAQLVPKFEFKQKSISLKVITDEKIVTDNSDTIQNVNSDLIIDAIQAQLVPIQKYLN